MSSYKKLIDLISRKKTPVPLKEFWQEFDKGLGQKLDTIDAQKLKRRVLFIDKIKDVLGLLLKPGLKPAFVSAFLLIMVIGGTLFFKSHQSIQFYSVASLSNKELVEELTMIEELSSLIDSLP